MRSIGIDIGLRAIKIVAVDGTPRRPRITHFVDHRLEEDRQTSSMDSDEIGRLLRRLLDKLKLPLDRVAGAVPAASCLIRDIQVPFSRRDQIEKTLKFQAESTFHSIQIDDMLVDYYKVEEIQGRSRLIVCAYKKEALERRLDVFVTAEVDPVFMDVDVAALFNAYMRTAAAASGKRVMLVDLGAGSLKVVIVQGGLIRSVRSLRANAAAVEVRDSSRSRPRDLEEFRAGLLEEDRDDTFFADDDGRLPVVILDEEQSELFDFDSEDTRQSILDKVFFEIDRTLARTLLDGPLEEILLTGGGSRAQGLTEAFAEHFHVDCNQLTLDGIATAKLKKGAREKLQRVGVTALGLALKGLGIDHGGFDLRREEFQFSGTFDRLKSGLACTLVLLFVLFFLVAYRFQIVETDHLYTKKERLTRYQNQIYQLVFQEEPSGSSVLAAFRRQEREIKRKLGQDVPDVVSTLDILRDFARATKDTGRKVALNNLHFRQRDASVTLEIDNQTVVYDIKKKLEAGNYLVRIASEKIDRDKQGKLKATLKLTVREEKKPGPKKPGRT
ncbi:pilus assembly protein PilM [Planctomycetota bacterium]